MDFTCVTPRSLLPSWVSMETIQLLGMESQQGGFWPGLRSLKCNIGWDIVPFISLLLNPTITILDLTLPREINRLLQPTLSLLAHTCRKLQSLKMNVDTSDPLSCSGMGRLISVSQRTLRRVDIGSSTPPDILPVLFNLPRLQHLILQKPLLPKQMPPKILPRLQSVTFIGDHGPNLLRFFGSLCVERLTTVAIVDSRIVQLSPLFELLRSASATMETLWLHSVAAHPGTILPCPFPNLTSLIIDCACADGKQSDPCSFQPTDENVPELGKALPRINSLRLALGCRAPCRATFTSLISLSRSCRSLVSLSIRVDFTSIVRGSDQLNRGNHSLGVSGACPRGTMSRLDTFCVGNSPLPNVPHCEWVVALALASIFPSIRSVSTHRPQEDKKWKGVQENILICQRIHRIAQAPEGEGLSVWCVQC